MEGEPGAKPEPEKPPRRAKRDAGTPRKPIPIDEVVAESQAAVKPTKPNPSKKRKKPPNANDRLNAWAERHLEDACNERDRLRGELAELKTNHDLAIAQLIEKHEDRLAKAHERLLEIEPQYEGLIRDHANLLNANLFNLVLTGFGASLISGAGYAPNPVYVMAILFSGITMFVIGSAQQILTTWRNKKTSPLPTSPQHRIEMSVTLGPTDHLSPPP